MHIKVLKTWCGIEGMFVGGEIREVDEAVLKKIGNKKLGNTKRLHYEEVPAPWDAQKDETAVRVTDLQGRIAKAAVELERLEDEVFGMTYRLGPGVHSLTAALENAEHDQIQAEQLFRQIEVKAGKAAENAGKHPTEANKKTASDLAAEAATAVRVVDGTFCLAKKAKAQLLLLNADIGLTELEVVDAKAELAAMQAELYELRPELKAKKQKAPTDRDSRAEKMQRTPKDKQMRPGRRTPYRNK